MGSCRAVWPLWRGPRFGCTSEGYLRHPAESQCAERAAQSHQTPMPQILVENLVKTFRVAARAPVSGVL